MSFCTHLQSRQSWRLIPCCAAHAAVLVIAMCNALRAESGVEIFQQQCAGCHGEAGQGVEGLYDGALYGEKSIADLAALIDETMPEDDPQSCTGQDAQLVAEYIYHEFYSLAARQRNGLVAAAHVQLTRLTETQYRNAIADLLLHFTPVQRRGKAKADDTPVAGLRAKYYQSKQMNKTDDLKLQQVDPSIDFEFGTGGPHEGIDPDHFAIVWTGTLRAVHTGYHEFRIRTQNGARLYFNHVGSSEDGKLRDDRSGPGPEALIDVWVGSGKMRERTTRVYLLGGRGYPLRLEFFKYKDPDASIELQWKPPHGVWSVIDESVLSTGSAPRTFVVDTPLPPDDRSEGYERGTSVSPEWLTATSQAALATADEVVDRLERLADVDLQSPAAGDKLAQFMQRFASVAFRRRLTDQERQRFGPGMIDSAESPELAVRSGVLQTLTSPHFLYNELPAVAERPSQHQVAARLAFALWDSLPDAELRAAADSDQLDSREKITTQARRMLSDGRTRVKMRGFFKHWLELDQRDVAKDEHLFPEFGEEVMAGLRRSLELFLEETVWSEASDYRQLLLADYLLLNDQLEDLYVAQQTRESAASEGRMEFAGYQRIKDSSGERSGVLTHPYLLSAFAYHDNTSPIHRGVFLTRNIVGRPLKPPPVAVSFDNAEFEPELTMREKVTQLTRDSACMRCHGVINPLGFVLENYDAVGRWRTTENDKPIDSRSDYVTVDGQKLELTSARELADYVSSSPAAHRAFVTQLYEHLIKQSPVAYGAHTAEDLGKRFAASDFNVQNLLVEIAVHVAAHEHTHPTTILSE